MPSFGEKSKKLLAEAHPDLQKVMNEAVKHFDFSVICGYRGKADQEKAFNEKRSKAHFGQSPHNFKPSRAVDITPFPLDWNDIPSFDAMGKVVMEAAKTVGVELTWGKEFSFRDYPHFELKGWRKIK